MDAGKLDLGWHIDACQLFITHFHIYQLHLYSSQYTLTGSKCLYAS